MYRWTVAPALWGGRRMRRPYDLADDNPSATCVQLAGVIVRARALSASKADLILVDKVLQSSQNHGTLPATTAVGVAGR